MVGEISIEDVLKPYGSYYNNFDQAQQKIWGLWSSELPKRIAMIKNNLKELSDKIRSWQNVFYFSLLMSAVIPIVVGILKETQDWSNYALLLDAVFPAVVGVVQKIQEKCSNDRKVYASVSFSYDQLLFEIIQDIDRGEYIEKEDIHRGKWKKLEKILLDKGLSYA